MINIQKKCLVRIWALLNETKRIPSDGSRRAQWTQGLAIDWQPEFYPEPKERWKEKTD